ncbi:uracil-DNA glycosylase [Halobacillus litoralis]|uniref:uracil-DNA glycosylase n=1 Tax=Halobacillus litoralis TaxID=45668 RepID=UPI001CD61354|nr:uracil-DNA glycosylase [Halobacillus litoralis]MCA0970415.1 uracil-DNA glycosylase [Halobacillus litoralis]
MTLKTFNNDWRSILEPEFQKEYYEALRETLKQEYQNETVYPPMDDIFSSLDYTSFSGTKVVILGQDPYHGPNQAHGFSFSVQHGVTVPPSLRNIFKELQEDVGVEPPGHGNLTSWAKEGVLLLNNVLTVRAHQAHSHQGIGWERFTDTVIQALNERRTPVVFILWGRHAQKKGKGIDTTKHLVLTAPHPSPLAAHRGFFGSRPFSKANQFLLDTGQEPVDWSLDVAPAQTRTE